MNRRILVATAAIAVLLLGLLPGAAIGRSPNVAARPLPASIKALKLAKPVTDKALKSKIEATLAGTKGRAKVYVRLKAAPTATLQAQGRLAQQAQGDRVASQQKTFVASVRRLDPKMKVLGQMQRATNIVAMQVDAKQLQAIARNPSVVSIKPVVNYQMALSETVPYIGATAVQHKGFNGKGIRVGVADSGIDYTHVEFGGAGTAAAYEAAYGTSPDDVRNTTLDGLFPTAKVAGGFDFVGETWPEGDGLEHPDPDPIDFQGHGTHVADIIGGVHGVAPGVKLYALKVCSAVDTACSGVALMQAVDWALDPNGDTSTADHLDLLNMSIGSDYGESLDDDLSLAIDTAYRAGLQTVAAAGNGGDLPYIAGSPANARTAIAVAQTQVPSAIAYPLVVTAPPSIAGTYKNTEVLDWSGFTTGFTGDVAYVGQGCPAGSITDGSPEDPYLTSPAGKVALIDRGGCAVSLKVERAAQAGATAAIIGLVAPGDAYPFANGGGTTFVPAISIQQSLSESIKTALGTATVSVTIGATSIKLVGSMAGTSSRGPSSPWNAIKPEIGAPGASVSAVAGSGTGMEAFGGTSGATPMITGSLALLNQAFPSRSNGMLRALIENNGETKIYNNKKTEPGRLAPITRIGGGEVRVDRALGARAAAWDQASGLASLSFGLLDAYHSSTVIDKTVAVHNFTSSTHTWKITSTFRYAEDKTNGAVTITTPSSITVPAGATRTFRVRMTVNGAKLRKWQLDAGPHATDAAMLSRLEYDGYVWLDDTSTTTDNTRKLHLPWQILPRKSARISVPSSAHAGDDVKVANQGIGVGAVDSYSLVGTSPNLPAPRPGTNSPIIDLKSVGVQTFPVPPDYCSADDSFVYVIAVNTWERHSTIGAFPQEFDVLLDTNRDGTPDFVIFTAPASSSDATWLTYSFDLNDPDAVPTAYFYTDNGTNDSNTLLTICGEQIGMNATNFFQPMDMSVEAYDDFFTGNLTDSITGMTVAPLGERWLGLFSPDFGTSGDVPAKGHLTMSIIDSGADYLNPSETGLLLVNNAYRFDGDYHGGAPASRDATRVLITP